MHYADPLLTVEYISYALHTLNDGMGASEQEDMSLLLDSLTSKMSAKVSQMNWTKMPEVLSITAESYVALCGQGNVAWGLCALCVPIRANQ